MTHLLPGGGVPRVHGAQSAVPPRLPHFATPWSVRHLATMVAGAYPPGRPANACPPPGPCYWLFAIGPPTGWRGGYLAAGLVRSTVYHYCLGGCSALVVCARRLRHVRGDKAGAGSSVFTPPPSSPALLAMLVAGRPVRVSLLLACRYAIRCCLSPPQAGSGHPSGPRRMPVVRVCTCAPGAFAPPPPPGRCRMRITCGSGVRRR